MKFCQSCLIFIVSSLLITSSVVAKQNIDNNKPVVVIKKQITIISLDEAAKRFLAQRRGRLIGAVVQKNSKPGSCVIYSVRLLTREGRVQTFHVDSCTGQELGRKSVS